MLIINADDWGRSVAETDSALRCFKANRVTSVSAMVFTSDSERAADLAKENAVDAGLHLNFTEPFTMNSHSKQLRDYHYRIVKFLKRRKYSQLLYNPFLRKAFTYSYQAQANEFARLFGKPPSRVDGHHHMHLCANLVLSNLIPAGMQVRRNFSFWPGEKSWLNRAYRACVDRWLARRYRLPDYFFDLTQCMQEKKLNRLVSLAKSNNVELMVHPVVRTESDYLMGDEFCVILEQANVGHHALV